MDILREVRHLLALVVLRAGQKKKRRRPCVGVCGDMALVDAAVGPNARRHFSHHGVGQRSFFFTPRAEKKILRRPCRGPARAAAHAAEKKSRRADGPTVPARVRACDIRAGLGKPSRRKKIAGVGRRTHHRRPPIQACRRACRCVQACVHVCVQTCMQACVQMCACRRAHRHASRPEPQHRWKTLVETGIHRVPMPAPLHRLIDATGSSVPSSHAPVVYPLRRLRGRAHRKIAGISRRTHHGWAPIQAVQTRVQACAAPPLESSRRDSFNILVMATQWLL